MSKFTKSQPQFLSRATIVLLLFLSSFLAMQAEQYEYWVNGIHYELDYGDGYDYYFGDNQMVNLRVVATNGSSTYSGEITIPETVTVRVSRYNGSHYGGDYVTVCRVTSIGENAFRDCTGLTGITLPKTLKFIGQNAFYGCTGLTRVTIANGVGRIDESAFAYCTSLTSIELPNSVTSIGWNTFYSCTALNNVTLSKSLTELRGTFHGCTALTSVTVPSGVTALDGTFNGCSSLASVVLPRSLRMIGENTFAGCSSLTGLYLPDGLMTIGNLAFSNTGLTTLELPSTVGRLGENAFDGSTSLVSVTSRNLNPPYMANNGVFSQETYGTAALYVPESSLSRYSSADWWNLFDGIQGKAEINNHYDFEVNGIYYLITGPNTAEVTYGRAGIVTYSGDVVIPSTVTHGGVTYNVTGIGNKAFKGSYQLSSVTMPQSITYIGNSAFANCSRLNTVDIPESVTALGDSAFFSSNMTELTIPAAVTSIGLNAFGQCQDITSLTWNARECWSNGNMATPSISQLTIGDGVKVIPSRLAYNSIITSLEIPSSVTFIGAEAFYGCANLTSLTIPENVGLIGNNAFYGTSGLTSLTWNATECWNNGEMGTSGISQLTIGNGVKVLPYHLASQSQITSVNIPESVINIGPSAFCYCNNLTSVVIPDNVVSIGSYAFNWCSNLDEVTIGKSVAYIDMYAFGYFRTLHWNARRIIGPLGYDTDDHYEDDTQAIYYGSVSVLTIGDEVEVLPDHFASGAPISTLEIPASVTSIGSQAFKNCNNLTTVTLHEGLTTMGDEVFAYCSNLSDVNLPESLVTMGDMVFAYCNLLNDVTFPEGLVSVGVDAFEGCYSFRNLRIPASLTSLGKRSFNRCNGLETIQVAAANPVYDSRDNCNAIFKTANDSIVLMCKNTTFPSSMTVIPDSMFYAHSDLTNFVIPPTVTRIGKDAFNRSGLTSITIPASVTSIGERAFCDCWSMTSIQVEEGNPVYDSRDNCNAIIETATNTLIEGCKGSTIPGTVTAIGKWAFQRKAPSSVTIPESVKTIADSAFYASSNLSSLVLGNGVETIGNYAFASCSDLRSITLGNSLTSIGTCAFSGTMTAINTDLEGYIVRDGQTDDGGYYHIEGNIDPYYEWDSWFYVYYYNDETGYTYENNFYGSPDDVYYVDAYGEVQYINLRVEKVTYSLVIPNSVTTIGNSAFSYCTGLGDIVLPNSLTEIGAATFANCSSLKNINIPETVKSIGNNAFSGCSALDSVAITSLAGWCDIDFYSQGSTPFYSNGNARLYLNGNAVIDLVVPDGVPAIKKNAFYQYKSLRSVTMPNSVTSIGNYAFYHCDSLAQASLSNSVTTIGHSAFYYCASLTGIDIPGSTTTIGDYAFDGCASLASVNLPNSVTTLGRNAFEYCKSLTSINIPNQLETINPYTFRGCTSLTSIDIPNTVTSIGDWAFSTCKGLTEVTIPNSVKNINSYAFYNCTGLTSVTLGRALQRIAYYAFNSCNAITSVTSYATTPPAAGTAIFSCYSRATLHVPEASREAYSTANEWKKFTTIETFTGGGPGDMDGDGSITVSDIVQLINAIINEDADILNSSVADVNGDGIVNVTDITFIINEVLNAPY